MAAVAQVPESQANADCGEDRDDHGLTSDPSSKSADGGTGENSGSKFQADGNSDGVGDESKEDGLQVTDSDGDGDCSTEDDDGSTGEDDDGNSQEGEDGSSEGGEHIGEETEAEENPYEKKRRLQLEVNEWFLNTLDIKPLATAPARISAVVKCCGDGDGEDLVPGSWKKGAATPKKTSGSAKRATTPKKGMRATKENATPKKNVTPARRGRRRADPSSE
jgi:hypothetical protein